MASLLVIDDDPLVLRSLALMLQKAGHHVVTGRDGREALGLLSRHPVDVMITDIIMPDREGIETIQEVRRHWPDLKIIAISGGFQFGGHEIQVLDIATKLGANYALKKPFGPDELQELIARCMTP